MDHQPEPDDRSWVRAFHRGYAVLWVLFGLCPPAVAVLDRSSGTRSWTLALLAVLGVAYGAVRGFRGRPALRPPAYLGMLIAGQGALSYLLNGGAALFVASLPQFWIYARTPRSAIAASGAAAAAAVAGGALRDGLATGNAAVTVLAYAISVLVGLLVHRIAADAAARTDRLGVELADAQQRLALAHQRQGAADERERMAREIHDTVAQGLASIVVLAEAARAGLTAAPEQSARHLLAIERTARDNLAEARVLVGAAPDHHAAEPIARTLRRTLDRFAEDTGLTVDSDLPDLECDQATRITLLRCTQESLANVRKHAVASTVSVVLAPHADGIDLEITDDGRGFVVAGARGFGLDGMRKRLADIGGDLTVTSAPGEGTRILATIPTSEQV
ncbi:sensor histidine kinase [Phytohabitans aurantiacus]|uniref:Oxygen sensor histidine kinase NreB n=1 Tax=Phytohabitans aurantiacus TaxID=3016789 RepID=A0ABQ5QSE0_9ACTN|nr:sensor histidine kinase [Phytohabitans aurantiacus]GLH96501.1 hypothetical protein Pa4123_17750 [Phytohabitans aurantiacus]